MIKLLKNVANLNNNFPLHINYNFYYIFGIKMYLSKENGDFVKDVLNIFTSPKLKWEKTTLIFSYSIDGHVMI